MKATDEKARPMTESKTIYSKLGIKPLINGQGTYTALGGSLMPPEVLDAMAEAAGWFVPMNELQETVGTRIAHLLGVPAAMVTAGAASAISVATAACMTCDKIEGLEYLPNCDGLKNEVIIQKAHQCGYEAQILLTGAKLVWVESQPELEHAISDRTAMMFFLNRHEPLGQIKRDEWIESGRIHGIPLFNDAAADTPPPGRFSAYFRQGFDLVAFSGGKALRGPQSSGLPLGRSDLIATGRLAISPHSGIGRGMKVGKEEIVGLLAAVERYLELDHDAEWRTWEARASAIVAILGKIPGASVRCDVPEIANRAPHVVLEWSPSFAPLTAGEIASKLLASDPPIAVLAEAERTMRIAVWTLRDDEHQILASKVVEIFQEGKG
jgi:L-seryl-tRNA(Ser) seleniumtransferase